MEQGEKIFYRGEGELIVKRIEHRSLARKVASWLFAGPIGYVLFGRDVKKKMKAKGPLVITNKAIYCAGNKYPYDKILAVAKKGRNKISLELEVFIHERGGGVTESRYSYEIEIKVPEVDKVMEALNRAIMSVSGVELGSSNANHRDE